MCEDYRASAPGGPDLRLDAADRGAAAAAGGGGGGGPVRKIRAPVRILWGARGVIQKLYDDPLALWAAVCEQSVRGRAVDAGHYLPEEASEEVVEEIGAFFT